MIKREGLSDRLENLQYTLDVTLKTMTKEQAALSERVEKLSDRLDASLQNLEAFNLDASQKLCATRTPFVERDAQPEKALRSKQGQGRLGVWDEMCSPL